MIRFDKSTVVSLAMKKSKLGCQNSKNPKPIDTKLGMGNKYCQEQYEGIVNTTY